MNFADKGGNQFVDGFWHSPRILYECAEVRAFRPTLRRALPPRRSADSLGAFLVFPPIRLAGEDRARALLSAATSPASRWRYLPSGRPASSRLASLDRKSTRLNSSHANISYAVFCLKKKTY